MIQAINRGWSDQSTASLYRLQEEAAGLRCAPAANGLVGFSGTDLDRSAMESRSRLEPDN